MRDPNKPTLIIEVRSHAATGQRANPFTSYKVKVFSFKKKKKKNNSKYVAVVQERPSEKKIVKYNCRRRNRGYLNIKFNVIDGIIGCRVERTNCILFNCLHSTIRRLQNIHSAPSVSDHKKFGCLKHRFPKFHT